MTLYEILSCSCGGIVFLFVTCLIIIVIEIHRAPVGHEISGVGFVREKKP